MSYTQKLTKIGNSVGIVIPKEVREILGIKPDMELYLEVGLDKKSIVLNTQKTAPKIDPEFYEILKDVNDQYSEALEELALK